MAKRGRVAGFRSAGFFVLRSPLLPWDVIEAWSTGLQAPAVGDDHTRLGQALESDRQLLRTRLCALLDRPDVREAVFVASPDLAKQIDDWGREPGSEKDAKVEHALVRYLLRMAGRATPFGLFAGCSTGRMADRSRFDIASRADYRRHTRLDMDYVFTLADRLGQNPALQSVITYEPNTSCYLSAGQVRYAEARVKGRQRTYHLVAVEAADYVLRSLALADRGAQLKVLATELSREFDVGVTEAEDFLRDLVESQMLIPEVMPTVTGPEPIPALIDCISRVPELCDTARRLRDVHEILMKVDASGVGHSPGMYEHVASTLEQLGSPVDLPRLFQVDMYKPAVDVTLGQDILADVDRAIDLMARLKGVPAEDPLKQFAERFTDRYETGEVPLVEALDDEMGIGFGQTGGFAIGPLLEGLAFSPASDVQRRWLSRQDYLLQKLGASLAVGEQEITLDDQDVASLTRHEAQLLPSAITVLAKVAASSPEAIDRGEYRVKFTMANASAVRFLGRFCHGDPELFALTKKLVEEEEALDPDAVFAEIVHLPEARVGNVMLRPALRSYEIPYLGRSSLKPDARIPISDLMVSVQHGHILLRSRRLNKRIMPRMATAHNFVTNTPTIYRFLCSLQTDGVSGEYAFPWGPLAMSPFLPRVVYGRVVLSLAQWRVQRAEWAAFGEAGTAKWYQAIGEWRRQRKLPRWAVLVDGDNTLPVDFDNIVSLESVFQVIKNRPEVVLEEMFPYPNELVVRATEGAFVHELVIPYIRVPQSDPSASEGVHPVKTLAASVIPVLSRKFGPGSEWLYAKIFAGIVTSDQVLREVVRPVVTMAMECGAADRWFFIRYGDPEWHLRLRIHGDPNALQAVVLPALHQALAPLLDDRRVWKWQLDTYEREVERYGGLEGASFAEHLFWADSEAVLSIVTGLEGDPGEELRWRLGLVGMDRLLGDLGYDLAAKYGLASAALHAFSTEFRVSGQLRGQMGDRFRHVRQNISELLNPSARSPWTPIFQQRSERMVPIVAQLRALQGMGKLSVPLRALCGIYIHMYVNRLLRSRQRAHELVLYDYLVRAYRSEMARASGGVKP